MNSKISKSIVTIGLIGLLFSCNSNRNHSLVTEDSSISEIMALAQDQEQNGSGVKAGDYYLEVERLYPFTDEAQIALLRAAEVYYREEAYVEARLSAERYIQYFPGAVKADRAQYILAMSYYNEILDVNRDQEVTFKALQAFQTLMEKYPNSQYVDEAAENFDFSLNQLAGKEMDIGRYYLAREHYTAAISRFKAVINEYPINAHTPEAYHRLIESYMRLGLTGEAQKTFAEFGNAYAQDEWYARSQSLLQSGTQSNASQNPLRELFLGGWQ